jgi:hypothetical protein
LALKTMGTVATTSLKAFVFQYASSSATFAADAASIEATIQSDQNPYLGTTSPSWGSSYGAFDPGSGVLFLPGGRTPGGIQLLPGDFIVVEPTTGWPMVVSALSAGTAGMWTHS